MKKRFLTMFSFILAFVICFACIACNDDEDEKKSAQKSAEMAAIGRIVDGVQKLATEDTFKATVAGNITSTRSYSGTPSSNNSYRSAIDLTVRKNGDWVRYTGTVDNGSADGYINLATGYLYEENWYYDDALGQTVKENGKYGYKMALPGGMVDMYAQMVSQEAEQLQNINSAGLEWLSDYITYDSRAKKAVIEFNIGEQVNGALQAVYNNANGNLYGFINELLADRYSSGVPAEKLIDEIIDELDKNKNKTVGEFLAILEQDSGMTLEQILQMAGASVDANTVAKIKSRKLGELIAAALELLNGSGSSASTTTVIDKLFVEKVTVPADLKNQLTGYKQMIVGALQNVSMSAVLQSMNLTGLVNAKFLFTNLSANAEFEFDSKGVIRAAAVSFNVGYSQNYNSGMTTSASRKTESYVGSYTFSATALPSSESGDVELDRSKISDRAFRNSVTAVYDGKNDISCYFEKGKKTVNLDLTNAQGKTGDIYESSATRVNVAGKLRYNSSTSIFTLDKSVMFGLSYGDELMIEVPLNEPIIGNYGMEYDSVRIYVMYMPSEISLEDLITMR